MSSVVDPDAREVIRDAFLEGDDDHAIQLLRDAVGDRRWVGVGAFPWTYVSLQSVDTMIGPLNLPVAVRILRVHLQIQSPPDSTPSRRLSQVFLRDVRINEQSTAPVIPKTARPISGSIFETNEGGIWNVKRVDALSSIAVIVSGDEWNDAYVSAALLVEILD